MANSDSFKKQQIIFPADNALIIKKLLEKYGFTESPKEIFEKARKGQEGFGKMIARIVRVIAENKLSSSKLSTILQKEFNLSQKKAEGLAQDIQKEILDLVNKPGKEISSGSPKSDSKEVSPPQRKDIYRESTE